MSYIYNALFWETFACVGTLPYAPSNQILCIILCSWMLLLLFTFFYYKQCIEYKLLESAQACIGMQCRHVH